MGLEPETKTPVMGKHSEEIFKAAAELEMRHTEPPTMPKEGNKKPGIFGNDGMKSDEDRCDPLPRTGQNSCSTNCPDGQPGERRRRWDMRRRRTLGRLIG